MKMRKLVFLSASIALVACSGCASWRHGEPQDGRVAKEDPTPAPRPRLSDALHDLSEWAER